jgi:hypothetical protein
MEKEIVQIGKVTIELFEKSELDRAIDFSEEEKAMIYYNSALITLYDFISAPAQNFHPETFDALLEIADKELLKVITES